MAHGWWDLWGAISGCVAAYQPVGAPSLKASYVNLANPGVYTLYLGTAPTLSRATGWGFNGSQYLKTGIVPGGNSTWGFVVRISNRTGTNAQRLIELQEKISGTIYSFGMRPSDGFAGRQFANTGLSNTTYADGAFNNGVIAMSGSKGYVNGASYITLTGTPGAVTLSKEIAIAGNHYYETGYETWTPDLVANMQAIAFYSQSVPAPAMRRIAIAVQRLPMLSVWDVMARAAPGAAVTLMRRNLTNRAGSRGVSE